MKYQIFILVNDIKILHGVVTFEKAAAISNVPTVSIFEAIIGTPLKVCFEFRNLISL